MSDFKDHFSGASDRYRRYRPKYPGALFDYLAEIAPGRDLAWDVACGNGQVAVELARRFDRVEASDASAQQIAEAAPAARVTYRVDVAERIAAEDGSVDLVTIGQAIHWLNHGLFFPEVDRVLRPGGVMAAWGYNFLEVDEPTLSGILERFRRTVESYWPPERAILDRCYRDIEFPYPALTSPAFSMGIEWTREDLLGYLSTWSSVKEYRARNGEDPLAEVTRELSEFTEVAEHRWEVRWPLVFYAGIKP